MQPYIRFTTSRCLDDRQNWYPMYYPEGMEGSGKPWVSKFIAKVIDRVFSFKNQSLLLIGRWLLISERINFKLSFWYTMSAAVEFGTQCQPTFSTELITSVADILGRVTLRSIIKQNLFVQQKKV